jgi:hypothetical protein
MGFGILGLWEMMKWLYNGRKYGSNHHRWEACGHGTRPGRGGAVRWLVVGRPLT